MMKTVPPPELRQYVVDGLHALGFGENYFAENGEPESLDIDDALSILLTNVRHVCDAYGLDYAETDRLAYEAYLRERAEAATAAAGDDADDQVPIVSAHTETEA